MAIERRALHVQVADEMRAKIAKGQWPAGAQIPTETQLREQYGVSKPTVRQAIAALRAEGLLSVQQGRGTYVRDAAATPPHTAIDRTVSRTSSRYGTNSAQWDDVEAPGVAMVQLDPEPAAALELPAEEIGIFVTRLLVHAESGARIRQTLLIPMEHAAGTPLADPNAKITAADAYTALAAAHGPVEWTESVTARQPTPDERAALHADVAPLLISRRVTRTQDQHRPLMLETITMAADTAELAYTIRPTRPAPRK